MASHADLDGSDYSVCVGWNTDDSNCSGSVCEGWNTDISNCAGWNTDNLFGQSWPPRTRVRNGRVSMKYLQQTTVTT